MIDFGDWYKSLKLEDSKRDRKIWKNQYSRKINLVRQAVDQAMLFL